MGKEILKDPVYNRFHAAFIHMLNTKWKGKQTLWGELSGVSKGSMADIKNLKRKPSFEKRNSLVEKCGMDYDEFLSLGATLLNESIRQQEDILVSIHRDLVSKFKHPEKGLSANRSLLLIEELDRKEFFVAVANLEAKALDLKEKKTSNADEQEDDGFIYKKNGTAPEGT